MSALGDYIARRRRELGLSQDGLAERLCELGAPTFTRHEVGRYERGARAPGPRHLKVLSKALDVSLPLLQRLKAGTVSSIDELEFEPGPSSNDLVHHFSAVLSAHRRTEDTYGPGPVFEPVRAQAKLVKVIAKESRSSVHDALLNVVSGHEQFLGWMAVDLGEFNLARQHYKVASEIARQLDDADMETSIHSMRSQLAWLAGDPKQALALTDGSRNVSASVGGLLEQQRARAYAMQGDARRTDYHLIRAEKLLLEAERQPEWTYFFDQSRLEIQRGIAYFALGKYKKAAELLEALKRFPDSYKRDRARYSAMRAAALALEGKKEEAQATLDSARALRVDSYLVRSDIAKAQQILRQLDGR